MCPRHQAADTLAPGLCLECGVYSPCLALKAFVFDNAAWLVIAAAAVMFLANLWWWYQLDFRIVG